jgi:tetratricopeptide (TPR) repeat protein
MKNFLLAVFCVFSFCTLNSQSNNEIAKVYLKRSQESLTSYRGNINPSDLDESLDHFSKAMKYTDTITSAKTARLGTLIYYEKSDFKEARVYIKQYFQLATNKSSDEYTELIEISVDINEKLEAQLLAEKKIEEERIRKEKELRRIDSLKVIWNAKSELLSLQLDSIYKFDKNNLALFNNEGSYGIINDKGEVVLESDDYKAALAFDGYVLFMNKLQDPTKIYCFNSGTKEVFMLPLVSDFNLLSTHYGKVMLPRGNGRLVLYPDNAYGPMVYDLNVKKIVRVANKKELFKSLKSNDIIDKYNKKDEVKINKDWYSFGGHVGGGIHALYLEDDYNVHSFLCSIDGNILYADSDYQYLGAFHNNKSQAIKDNKTVWVNQNGTKVSTAKDDAGEYSGSSTLTRLNSGAYQITQDGVIILGKERLEKLPVFLRNNK